ncbi:hypothetical protein K1T71_004053 [Dendrolimus kikuchii]|uniref:Uncharacterized protein n=1 Tax=Dendrolimus kikuchii TaxID=765133 RepID=A0ACC1D9K4_9NEOP|nr:hypothetical protein K1T71_004053 [Dendrolimus kikuchii]
MYGNIFTVLFFMYFIEQYRTFRTSMCLQEHEQFSLCGWKCPPTCVNMQFLSNALCLSPWACKVGCRCSPGYVRDEYSKKCVLAQDCPDKLICPPGEVMGSNLQCIATSQSTTQKSYWLYYDMDDHNGTLALSN